MYALEATVNLGDYRSQRVDVAFPFGELPEGWTYDHARAWVAAWFRYEVERIVRGAHARGDHYVLFPLDAYVGDSTVVPPEHPALPMPPADPTETSGQARPWEGPLAPNFSEGVETIES